LDSEGSTLLGHRPRNDQHKVIVFDRMGQLSLQSTRVEEPALLYNQVRTSSDFIGYPLERKNALSAEVLLRKQGWAPQSAISISATLTNEPLFLFC
jgi:hypothetical protein